MNRERIEETFRLWQAQPDKAKGKPMVIARAEGSMTVMEHGTFSWCTDMPVSLGGTNEAPRASPRRCLEAAQCVCLLMAQNGHASSSAECPLSGVKRTRRGHRGMSVYDPKQTSRPSAQTSESDYQA
jgi:hypothetical protein